ncbi:MAG TPA: hypothetical protein PKL60_01605 [Anaerolineaceae bacterium]|nr:hypothetical protein [Anaerolineaceae bacterium]
MTLVTLNLPSPDFSLVDVHGNPVRLSDFKGVHHVILILNRGFT